MKIAAENILDYLQVTAAPATHVLLYDAPPDCDEPVIVPFTMDADTTLEQIAKTAIRRMPTGCRQVVYADRSGGASGTVIAVILRDGLVCVVENEPGESLIWHFEPGVGIEVRGSIIRDLS